MQPDIVDSNPFAKFPSDIFDTSFVDEKHVKRFDDCVGKFDLTAPDEPKVWLPSIYQGPAPQSRSGRRNELDTELASRQIEIALGSKILYAYTVLRELGFGEYDTNEKLTNALSGSRWELSTTLKQGRKDCRAYFNIPSPKRLKGAADQFKNDKGRLKVKKEAAVQHALFGIPELSRAQVRTKRLNKDGHDLYKIVRDKKYAETVSKIFAYHSDDEKPSSGVDGLIVALTAGIDPSAFWAQFSFVRHIYKSIIPLGYSMRGIRHGFNAQQLYTLYRICTHDFQHKPLEDKNSTPLATILQESINFIIDSVYTREGFLRQAYRICLDFGLFSYSKLTANQIATLSELQYGNRRFIIE